MASIMALKRTSETKGDNNWSQQALFVICAQNRSVIYPIVHSIGELTSNFGCLWFKVLYHWETFPANAQRNILIRNMTLFEWVKLSMKSRVKYNRLKVRVVKLARNLRSKLYKKRNLSERWIEFDLELQTGVILAPPEELMDSRVYRG